METNQLQTNPKSFNLSEEKMVQKIVAGMTGWKAVVQSALPSMMILFYGSWSDR